MIIAAKIISADEYDIPSTSSITRAPPINTALVYTGIKMKMIAAIKTVILVEENLLPINSGNV